MLEESASSVADTHGDILSDTTALFAETATDNTATGGQTLLCVMPGLFDTALAYFRGSGGTPVGSVTCEPAQVNARIAAYCADHHMPVTPRLKFIIASIADIAQMSAESEHATVLQLTFHAADDRLKCYGHHAGLRVIFTTPPQEQDWAVRQLTPAADATEAQTLPELGKEAMYVTITVVGRDAERPRSSAEDQAALTTRLENYLQRLRATRVTGAGEVGSGVEAHLIDITRIWMGKELDVGKAGERPRARVAAMRLSPTLRPHPAADGETVAEPHEQGEHAEHTFDSERGEHRRQSAGRFSPRTGDGVGGAHAVLPRAGGGHAVSGGHFEPHEQHEAHEGGEVHGEKHEAGTAHESAGHADPAHESDHTLAHGAAAGLASHGLAHAEGAAHEGSSGPHDHTPGAAHHAEGGQHEAGHQAGAGHPGGAHALAVHGLAHGPQGGHGTVHRNNHEASEAHRGHELAHRHEAGHDQHADAHHTEARHSGPGHAGGAHGPAHGPQGAHVLAHRHSHEAGVAHGVHDAAHSHEGGPDHHAEAHHAGPGHAAGAHDADHAHGHSGPNHDAATHVHGSGAAHGLLHDHAGHTPHAEGHGQHDDHGHAPHAEHAEAEGEREEGPEPREGREEEEEREAPEPYEEPEGREEPDEEEPRRRNDDEEKPERKEHDEGEHMHLDHGGSHEGGGGHGGGDDAHHHHHHDDDGGNGGGPWQGFKHHHMPVHAHYRHPVGRYDDLRTGGLQGLPMSMHGIVGRGRLGPAAGAVPLAVALGGPPLRVFAQARATVTGQPDYLSPKAAGTMSATTSATASFGKTAYVAANFQPMPGLSYHFVIEGATYWPGAGKPAADPVNRITRDLIARLGERSDAIRVRAPNTRHSFDILGTHLATAAQAHLAQVGPAPAIMH